MELEIYDAFRSAGVAEDKARAAVESINREIDRRYALHSQQLATRGDVETIRKEIGELEANTRANIAEAKAEIIKWTVATMFAAVALFASITKLWQ